MVDYSGRDFYFMFMVELHKKYDFVALYSGGLDSSLAIKIIAKRGFSVLAIKFATPFSPGKRITEEKFYFNASLGVDTLVVPLGESYVELIKSPQYGYGSNMNPCIDCKIFFLREAKRVMETIGAKGIITGEVLGQRPMSQNIQALQLIERKSGTTGILLRPLSGKLLPQTELEKSGIISREDLYDINGRTRRQTLELAKRLGVVEFTSPAGGCLLTDPGYARRLKESLEHSEYHLDDLEALKFGRHFRLPDKSKLIVGRNEFENNYLAGFLKNKIILEDALRPGPTCFLSPQASSESIRLSAEICAHYSKSKDDQTALINIKAEKNFALQVKPADDKTVRQYIISL